ncbi:MAG: acyl-CoA dehydrogenase family protein [Pseudomonadota bacterium]|nr:acyl-CoA dehydrogenase family protein [Pseudomonadota bacterium]
MSKHEELVAVARSLTDTFRARAAEAETNRRLHRETHEAMLEAGLYRVQMPKRYGGFEMSHRTMLDISIEIGRGCGSSGWLFSNIAAQNGIVAMASRQLQDEVWAKDGSTCTASSFPAKGGKVERVDGGLVANGVWSFASGVDWSDWNNMQVFVPNENGGFSHHMALVPKSDYRVIDDWYSPGMAATGSRSIELKNVFIPEHRLLNTADARAGKTVEASENFGPIFRVPPMCGANKIFSGPVIGMARGALDAIERDLSTRNNVAGAPMATLTTAQMRVAEAGALIEAAWALMQRDCDVALEIGELGRLTTVEDRAFWRRNNAYAGVMSVKAVETLHPLLGARGLTPQSDFMRAYRDIHAATMQINMAWDRHAITAAELQLGLMPTDPRA